MMNGVRIEGKHSFIPNKKNHKKKLNKTPYIWN